MPLKDLKKRMLRLYTQSGVKPLKSTIHVGSAYHGYYIPDNFLEKQSVCYLVGSGDDISFDIELKKRYDSEIVIIDPTPAAKDHYLKVKESMEKNLTPPKVHADPGYVYKITSDKFNEMKYVEMGVWTEKTVLKFHDPEIGGYVSQSVFLFQDSKKVMELPVDRIGNLMKSLHHEKVDLVKLEIEGAEYAVIDTILEDKLDVKMILVEFDEVYHKKGIAHLMRIRRTCAKLRKAGYVLTHSTNKLKRTFVRKDVYKALKAKERNALQPWAFAGTNR
jgi:FkbM family methyltransferase